MTDTYPESLNCDIHTHYCIAKADTGASNHYWMKKDGNILKNVQEAPGTPYNFPIVKSYIPRLEGKYLSPKNYLKTQKKP